MNRIRLLRFPELRSAQASKSVSKTSQNFIQRMSIPRHASTRRGIVSQLARVLSESVSDQNDRDRESFPARHVLLWPRCSAGFERPCDARRACYQYDDA